ncbi:hypothetical protein [Flagellimonas sp.]|uniref:hypothetical protein n=1 Tax=Flagellimonas sp. TaxID=2058762 RepID=UPI003B5AFC3B
MMKNLIRILLLFFVCSGVAQQCPSNEGYNGFLIDRVTGKRQAAIKHLMVQLMRGVVDHAYIEEYLEREFPYPSKIYNKQMGRELKTAMLKSKKRGGSFYNGISKNFGEDAFRTLIKNIPKQINLNANTGLEDEKFISFVCEHWSYRFSPAINMGNGRYVIVMKNEERPQSTIAYVVSCEDNRLKIVSSYYLSFLQ